MPLAAAFVVVAGLLVFATQTVSDRGRLVELASYVLAGGVALAVLTAQCVRRLVTRRLTRMAVALEAMVHSAFTTPLQLAGADPNGDEIDRLTARIGRMSEQIVRQLEQLQRAESLRRELLANVSHDLRTPLASMQGYLELLLLKHGTMPQEEERSYLEVATRHCERLGKLIRDLFQLAKLEAHEAKPQCELFSAAELVQDVLQKQQLAAEKLGLKLDSRFSGQQLEVHADIAMIETVLENLIANALRHTPPGGQVRVDVQPQAGRMAVRVADTGCGIAEEDVAKLFDRYYHVDRSGATDGTGLGLAIVRRIVELHGGTIRVESALGRGSTFGFDLPISAAGTPPPARLSAVSEPRS